MKTRLKLELKKENKIKIVAIMRLFERRLKEIIK
jgi:hypothetical protein